MIDASNHDDLPMEGTAQSAWTSQVISELMSRHGVGQRHQATLIAQICSISVSQARRKLRGAVWLFDEVVAVCQHFGASLAQVFDLANTPPGDAVLEAAPQGTAPLVNTATSYPALLLVDELRLPCDIQIGALCAAPLGTRLISGLVALHQPGDGWLVGSPERLSQPPLAGPHYEVNQLNLQAPENPARARIAILDDDARSGAALSDWFNELGYQAHAYTTAEQLLAIPLHEHDAFIIDLILGRGQTSEGVIEHIRGARPTAPIVLLTGRLRDGTASEATLSTMLRTQGVTFFEKPVRPAVLTAAIQSSLDRAGAHDG